MQLERFSININIAVIFVIIVIVVAVFTDVLVPLHRLFTNLISEYPNIMGLLSKHSSWNT